MFGTMVEVDGGRERRWGGVMGVRRDRRNLRGFSGRALRGFSTSAFGDSNPVWVFDEEGNVTIGDTPSAGPDYLSAVLDTLKTVAPSVLGVVQAAVNRGVTAGAGGCPPGYAYYSPIVGRCFRTPGEMSAAESAVQQAQSQYGGGTNTFLMAGAIGLIGLGIFFALKK